MYHNPIMLNSAVENLKISGESIIIDATFGGGGHSKEILIKMNRNCRLFATLDNLLVAGTGNKVEDFGVGFYTKYGDGGVDVSPIADLLKSEVRDIANALEINKCIIEAKPTDGLWDDNRTDEQQLNASYEELEWAMKQTFNGKKIDSFSAKERQILTTFYKHNNANKHKMNPIPVCNIPFELK